MRYSRRVDGNQRDIVTALRAIGCSVQSLASVGDGCPDLLVGYRRQNFVIEVKNPQQDPNKRALTPAEQGWIEGWRGEAHIVETAEQAVEIVTR